MFTFGVLYVGLLNYFANDSNADLDVALNFSNNLSTRAPVPSALSGELGNIYERACMPIHTLCAEYSSTCTLYTFPTYKYIQFVTVNCVIYVSSG